jgi:hypothetical protein
MFVWFSYTNIDLVLCFIVVDITQDLIEEAQSMICESTVTRIIFEFDITYVFIVSCHDDELTESFKYRISRGL